MSKKTIIFISLIIALLATAVYLVARVVKLSDQRDQSFNGNQTINQNSNQQADKQVDLGLLVKTYQMEVKVIFNNYLRQAQDKNILTSQFVSQAKNQLLALKVPAKFKELHLNLVLALTNLEDYLIDGDEKKLQASDKLINQIRAEYEWLTD